MEGFMKIKISKVKRAMLTRSITIIPSLVVIFFSDPDAINNSLNVL